MSNTRSGELSRETGEHRLEERRLETLDDIPREIADRRLHAEFSEFISPEQSKTLRERQDRIEKPEDFKESAKKAGLDHTEDVIGWSTNLESPAHVLKGEIPKEVTTLIHEDLHRFTHPETLKEMRASPELHELYEGVTEYLTDRAATGLHDYKAGEFYPEQVKTAEKLAAEVGETNLRKFFFQHELTEEVEKALDQLSR
jgi:hypothetical protein